MTTADEDEAAGEGAGDGDVFVPADVPCAGDGVAPGVCAGFGETVSGFFSGVDSGAGVGRGFLRGVGSASAALCFLRAVFGFALLFFFFVPVEFVDLDFVPLDLDFVDPDESLCDFFVLGLGLSSLDSVGTFFFTSSLTPRTVYGTGNSVPARNARAKRRTGKRRTGGNRIRRCLASKRRADLMQGRSA